MQEYTIIYGLKNKMQTIWRGMPNVNMKHIHHYLYCNSVVLEALHNAEVNSL